MNVTKQQLDHQDGLPAHDQTPRGDRAEELRNPVLAGAWAWGHMDTPFT